MDTLIIRLAWPVPLAVVAAILSIAIQGFEFGINNNVFHIPLVLSFDLLPQFVGDPVIHSLRRFVSPIYVFFSTFATEGNIETVFFLIHFVTRILTFAAIFLIAQAVGVSGLALLATAAVLSVARGIYGAAFMSGGGMLMKYFTHSELSTAFALLSIAALLHNRLIVGAFLGGITFAINIFIGVWMAFPIALVAFGQLFGSPAGGISSGKIDVRVRSVILAAFAYTVPAFPIGVWVLSVVGGGNINFDYRSFLYSYYGQHFFIETSSFWSVVQCISAATAAVLALFFISNSRLTANLLVGLFLVLALGILIGRFSESYVLLNLNFLRVDAVITILAATLVAVGAFRQIALANPLRTLIAIFAIIGVITGIWILVAVGMGALCLIARLGQQGFQFKAGRHLSGLLSIAERRPGLVTAVISLTFVTYAAAGAYLTRRQPSFREQPTNAQLEGFRPASPEWRDVQVWARENTSENARFLVPLWPGGFRIGARRVAWVDWKEGATAMWAPETYSIWRRRVDEVLRLRNSEEKLAYACANHLDYIILDLRGASPVGSSAETSEYINRSFSVRRVRGCR